MRGISRRTVVAATLAHIAAEGERTRRERLESAPIGTKAPAIGGGHWVRVEHGWKWFNGDTFPTPGADWTGELILPNNGGGEVARG